MINYAIQEVNNDNIDSLALLQQEAEGETMIVSKMVDEWKSGENTFSKTGEKAWGLFVGDECIAFAGINVDPYLEGNDGSVGRVRHVYVAQKYRGQGLSKVLMDVVLAHAKEYFKTLRLSTNNPIALRVYLAYGFAETEDRTPAGKPVYALTL